MTKGISKTGKAKDVRNKDLFYAILINLVIFMNTDTMKRFLQLKRL